MSALLLEISVTNTWTRTCSIPSQLFAGGSVLLKCQRQTLPGPEEACGIPIVTIAISRTWHNVKPCKFLCNKETHLQHFIRAVCIQKLVQPQLQGLNISGVPVKQRRSVRQVTKPTLRCSTQGQQHISIETYHRLVERKPDVGKTCKRIKIFDQAETRSRGLQVAPTPMA